MGRGHRRGRLCRQRRRREHEGRPRRARTGLRQEHPCRRGLRHRRRLVGPQGRQRHRLHERRQQFQQAEPGRRGAGQVDRQLPRDRLSRRRVDHQLLL